MSEKEHRLDVCPECSTREGDSSEKKVYQCPHCESWFCERHLEPRLGITRNFEHDVLADAEIEWRIEVEKDWAKKDGHPDWVYTRKKFEEIENTKKKSHYEIGCPNCESSDIYVTGFDERQTNLRCSSCGHVWIQVKPIIKHHIRYHIPKKSKKR